MRRVVLLVMLGAGALGCAMRVRGAVTDARSGHPIPNAFVSSDCYPTAVATDGQGRFELKTRWSDCTLTVFAPGYRTRIVPMRVEDNRYPQQDVALWRAGEIGPTPPAARRPRTSRR